MATQGPKPNSNVLVGEDFDIRDADSEEASGKTPRQPPWEALWIVLALGLALLVIDQTLPIYWLDRLLDFLAAGLNGIIVWLLSTKRDRYQTFEAREHSASKEDNDGTRSKQEHAAGEAATDQREPRGAPTDRGP